MGSSITSRRKARIVYDLVKHHKLKYLLRAAGLAESTYHRWRARFQAGETDTPDPRIAIVQAVCARYKYKYGYRRIRLLLRDQGLFWSGKTVLKLMRAGGCLARVRKKPYPHGHRVPYAASPNVVARAFTRTQPGQLWVTDITEFNIHGVRVFMCVIKDTCTKEIVAYATGSHPDARLVDRTLASALAANLITPGLIIHSDQGGAYKRPTFTAQLHQAGITQSMSRAGQCLDNAAIESLFSHMKTELFYDESFPTVSEFKTALAEYVYHYNYERPQLCLNGLTPKQTRATYNPPEFNTIPLPQLSK